MSKNGKSSLTPKAKEAAERFKSKAFAKALDQATGLDPRITDVLSTKGTI